MDFAKLIDNLINERIEEDKKPIEVLVEISDETYEYIVDAAEDLNPGTMNSYFGGQQRVVIPLQSSDNKEVQKFYDEIVNPLSSKGIYVDLKDGTAKQYVKTQKGTKERVSRLGKVINKHMSDETKAWWNKNQASFLGHPEILDNPYSIVISQSPVDVARMSDYREIQSCHSPGADYFQCALADARRAGAIAYLINSKDAPYIESHANDAEVFADSDRDVEGVTPLARVRLRRIDYIDESGFIDALLVPETRVYGRRVPGFVNTVIDWAREEQDNHEFFKKKLDTNKLYHRGGRYSDSDFATMFNNLLGLENIELNDNLDMYETRDTNSISPSDDEDYVDHVSTEGRQRQMDHAEEMMNDMIWENMRHDDVKVDYDLEYDEWGESVIIESWKITMDFDFPIDPILNSEFIKNNENVNVDPEDPNSVKQDELNHNSVWRVIEPLIQEAYENSDYVNSYLEIPEVDAQAEHIRFGQDGKLIYRIKLVWEGGGDLIPTWDQDVAQEIYNVINDIDELKEVFTEALIEEEMYEPTEYQKVRKSIEYDEEELKSRLDGKLLGHFRFDLAGGEFAAYSNEPMDNYPAPGIRKVGKFPEWTKADESPPLAHILGFSEENYKGMATYIAYSPKQIIGMLLNLMWTNKVIDVLRSDLEAAAKAAEDQLALMFLASDGDMEEDEEWKEHKNALEILDNIYIYFSSDVIYRGGESPYTGNAPSRRATGGLYFKFKETDNVYTIRGLVAFLKYFDKNYNVVQDALQAVWDDFVQAYNENAPVVQEEALQFLRNMIQEVINETMNIEDHPQRESIIAALNDPNYLVHFSDINKVGINPGTQYNTPAGIYGWHWTDNILDRASKNTLFGSKRKFAHLMKVKDGAKVLWLGDDEKTGQLPDIAEAADIFFNEYPDLGEKTEYYFPHDGQSWALQEPFIDWIQDKYPKFAKTSYRKHGGGSQTENLYDFVMAVSRLYADEILKDDTKRTILANKMLRLLGFDAVIDTRGEGIIHGNEPQQGFFTNIGGLDTVATIDNEIYSMPSTAVMSILLNPDAPADKIEEALTAVLETDTDIGKSGKGSVSFSLSDRLDILDYATQKNTSLTTDQLNRISSFVKGISEESDSWLMGPAIERNIISHPNVSDEMYQRVADEVVSSSKPDSLTVAALIRNPSKATPEFLKAVAEGEATTSLNDRVIALRNPNMPVDVLLPYIEEYSKFFEFAALYRLASSAMKNPSVPRSALLDLLYDEDGQIVVDNNILRDIVTNPNLPVEAMSDILETIKDKERMRDEKIFVDDIYESFIMSPFVPDDMALQIMQEYPNLTNPTNWELRAADLLRRALRRNYTEGSPKKVNRRLLNFVRDTFEDIRNKSEYDMTNSQQGDIMGLLNAQGAYKNQDSPQKESKDLATTLKDMISEQIKIAIGEKQEDSEHVTKAVLNDGRRVLLIRRSQYCPRFANQWDLPGGHIHIGEEKEKGLEREVKEETGLCIEGANELFSSGDETFYIADIPDAPIKLSEEHTEHKMVDIDEIGGYDDLSPKYKDVILTAMEDAPLTENMTISLGWKEFIQQHIEEFFPEAEIRDIQKIGSSALSREEQIEQDMEKYGFVRDEEDRDIDVEVQVSGIFPEDVERWAFSEEAEELEQFHNYDVQIRIVENKIISEMFVKGDPDGDNIVAYRENIWRMGDIPSDEVRDDINDSVGIEAEWEGFYDLKDELDNENRMDVLFGTLLENGKTLHLDQIGSFKLDPKSSVLVKKVVKELGVRKIVYPADYNWGDEEEVPFYGARGKIADVMYHGTTSNYLENILKFGLVPGESKTNYEGISHPNAVFFSSRMEEAQHHAVHTASKVGGDPVIASLNVPDPALLIPDYDVDMGAGDTGCFDYICHTLRNRQAGDLDVDSFSLSREVGVYGYKGRIPASAIFAYDILMNAEETMDQAEMYDARLGEYTEATPEEAATYIETKDNLGMGVLEYPEWYFNDEDEEE